LLPIFLLPAKRVGRRLAGITREGFNVNAEMNATMTERFGVSGALLVKLFGRHDLEAQGFSARAGRVRDIGVQSAMYSRTFMTALTLVGAVGTAVIYLVGGRLVISGTISTGTLVALGVLVTQIYSPLTSLTNARVDLMTAFVSFDRVFEVLDAPNPITDAPDAVDLVAPRGRIELDHVTFAYPSGADSSVASLESAAQLAAPDLGAGPVLHDLTATIEPGELVALVGPSGAGKTTVSQLIPRLYDVTSGAVRVDGHDVRDLTQASLRKAIGVVSQDPHLFHESVADNLRYAAPRPPTPRSRRPPGPPASTTSSPPCPTGTHHRGRAGVPPLGRREAAARHRPHAAQGPGHRDPRRGHLQPRQRERGRSCRRPWPRRWRAAPRS
jgi:ATP-binding cassette subfamily B protein